MKSFSSCFLAAVLWPAAVPTAQAVELSDLAGAWALAEMETPARLREVYYDTVTMTNRTTSDSSGFGQLNEILSNAFYPDPAAASSRTFTISANGAVTGGETGQVLNISNNRILYADGTDLTTVYANTTGDLLVAAGRDIDQQELSICLKRPASLLTSELAGTWHLVSRSIPKDLSKNINGNSLTDVWYSGDIQLLSGEITGVASGAFTGLFSGTLTATGPGTANVVTGADTIPFDVNASKDVMATTRTDDDEAELILLVRRPATLATSELQGIWRLHLFQLPSSLTESWFNTVTLQSRQADSDGTAQANEILSDLFHTDTFQLNRFTVTVDASGNLAGFPEGGTLTANPNQTVAFSGGDTFHINASKTLMIGGFTDPDSHTLAVMVKTSGPLPPGSGSGSDFDLNVTRTPDGKLVFNWNGVTNASLEELTGTDPEVWSEVTETSGTDAHLIDPSTDGFDLRLFRIAETP